MGEELGEGAEPPPAAQAAAGCFLTRSHTWFVLNEWEKSVTRRGSCASLHCVPLETCPLELLLPQSNVPHP